MQTAAPTVLWRLFRRPGHHSLVRLRPKGYGETSTKLGERSRGEGGAHARAVILPGGPPYTLAFFSNDAMDRAENYDTMEIALFRAQAIRQSLIDDGWVED